MQVSTNNTSKRILVGTKTSSHAPKLRGSRGDFLPNSGILIVALLAMIAVQVLRISHSQSLPVLFVEIALFTALPLIALGTLRIWFNSDDQSFLSKSNIIGFQAGAILVAISVVLWHCAIRQFGYGAPNEFIALMMIQSAGWYLAVFSKVPGFEKTSCLLSGAIVFFVCCIANDIRIFTLAAVFAFVGLWWLLGQYWSRLESTAIDGDSRMLKLQGSAVTLTMLIIALVGCIAGTVPFTQNGISVMGFMPFSGGERGSENEFAISGIGDGDMLTAGNNATTAGAVESDQFIEDDKPSLYDIMSEQYDGPIVKKKRFNRAVALDEVAKHLHEVKQSEQAGRTFRTLRDSSGTTNIELEDRTTKALFFVEGSAPARFAINTFCEFDGWDWKRQNKDSDFAKPRRINLRDQNGVPVFSFVRSIASYLTGKRTHRVKIMRLETKTLPSPALLQRWHLPLVDKLDLFGWGEAGLVEMEGESIPTHAIIDLQSLVPNFHLLREREHLQSSSVNIPNIEPSDSNSPYLQIPENNSTSTVKRLAEKWTAEVEPGWLQVESIVNNLRTDFQLKPDWETSDEVEDSVNHFLNQGGGPSYMFATTCAMCLRSMGYETRLAKGFLVQKKDYDSHARQSVVTARNLHTWPEVCLDGEYWIPVEPSPGYPTPYNTQTSWQWVATNAVAAWTQLINNPITVILSVGSALLAILFRAEWITSLMYLWWFLVRTFWPQRLLKTTRQLIDLRFSFSGEPRPASQTISDWYTRVESKAAVPFMRLWNAENYSDQTARVSRPELVLTCRQLINSLSLKRIRAFHAMANPPISHDTEI